MEVGNQAVGNIEAVARRNENIGIAATCFQTACFACGGFQGAHGGCAHRPHFIAARFGGFNGGNGLGRYVKPLAVHFVFFNFIDAYGLECAGTDVQGYFCGFYAFGFQTAQQLIGKVQTCRRRGHCALIFGVHGLIAAVVFIIGRAFDIRRQGQMAVLL